MKSINPLIVALTILVVVASATIFAQFNESVGYPPYLFDFWLGVSLIILTIQQITTKGK